MTFASGVPKLKVKSVACFSSLGSWPCGIERSLSVIPLCYQLGELRVTVSSQELDRVGRHSDDVWLCSARRNSKVIVVALLRRNYFLFADDVKVGVRVAREVRHAIEGNAGWLG